MRVGAAGAAAVALVALALWVADRWRLGTFGTDYVPMAPSTALAMTLLAGSVLLRSDRPDRRWTVVVAAVSAAVVATFAALVLAAPVTGAAQAIEHLLAGDDATASGIPVGRMSPLTAAAFLLAAASLSALLVPARLHRRSRTVASVCATGVTLTSVVAVSGYAAGAPILYGTDVVPMALTTAVAFLLLGAALVVAPGPGTWPLRMFVAGDAPDSRRRLAWALVAVLLTTTAGAGIVGFRHLAHVNDAARRAAWNDLGVVADLKVAEISAWRKRRQREADALFRAIRAAPRVGAFLADPSDAEGRREVAGLLALARESGGYDRAVLMDLTTGACVVEPPDAAPAEEEDRDLAREAVRVGAIQFTEPHAGGPAQPLEVDVAIPAGGGGSGAVVLTLDLRRSLLPAVRSWPTASPTAETVLVTRQGDDVVFLTGRGDAAAPPTPIRRSVADPRLPAAMGARGEVGAFEGVDHRGVPVLAAVRTVPGTPWTLVAKVDREEVLAAEGGEGRAVVAGIGLITLASWLAVALVWWRWDARLAQRRLETERERRAAAERAGHLMRAANDVILLTDVEGRILDANDRAVAAYGRSLDELRRMRLADVRAPSERAKLAQDLARLAAEGDAEVETVHLRADGTTFPVESRARFVEIGGERQVLAIVRDVTVRRAHEREIERLAAVIEQAPASIVITDVHGAITYVNPAFEKTSGWSRAEVLGRNPSLLKSGRHDQAFYADMWATLTRGEMWAGRLVNRRKDGTPYVEDATISQGRDAAGRVAWYVAAKRDVTHEVELESQLQQAQKMEAVGRLAGGVAHDFNNLLCVIQGYGDMLARHEGDALVRDYASQIQTAAERAARLTQQLLAFSRRQVLDPRILDLGEVVSESKRMLDRILGEDVEVVLALDPALGRVHADAGQIQQVVMNLAVNARDAMPDGGRLVFATDNVDLDGARVPGHPGTVSGRFVRLRVSDTGCGMDAATLGRIFEPFFTTKPAGRGTGLGLSTVYGIVEQSGGFVDVESEVGRGTTFAVHLPLVEQATEVAAAPVSAPPDASRGGETVLVAEDEDAVRRLVVEVLESAGYRVLTSDTPEDVLAVAQRTADPVALLVTDVVMPRMSGPDLAERVRAVHPGVRVLLISGYPGDPGQGRPVPTADADFLSKPFAPPALLRKVREVLDRA